MTLLSPAPAPARRPLRGGGRTSTAGLLRATPSTAVARCGIRSIASTLAATDTFLTTDTTTFLAIGTDAA